jgi:hypothetical protein
MVTFPMAFSVPFRHGLVYITSDFPCTVSSAYHLLLLVSSLAYSSTLKVMATCSSWLSPNYTAITHPEDCILFYSWNMAACIVFFGLFQEIN